MTKFAVDSSVPAPSESELRARCTVYPFDRMAVGQSFVIRDEETRWRVHRAMLGYMKRHKKFRFVIRRDPRNGWRCWRV